MIAPQLHEKQLRLAGFRWLGKRSPPFKLARLTSDAKTESMETVLLLIPAGLFEQIHELSANNKIKTALDVYRSARILRSQWAQFFPVSEPAATRIKCALSPPVIAI